MTKNEHSKRRRGKELEHDLLEAAWNEFQDKGYDKLTMEGIAARAETTKTVLYRRWPNKAIILINSFKEFGPKVNMDPVDTGNLRDDLVTMMEPPIQLFEVLGKEAVQGLIADQVGDQIYGLFEHISGDEAPITKIITPILHRADERGEVKMDNMDARVTSLPAVLLISTVLSQGMLTKKDLVDIVDDVVMPVFKHSLDK
ncbi:TetR/AcrR family transcriptional regulator [Paucilactobacillus suebicus]|uniref:TetR family transcriptional regulator n=1 Tax=Paucilactobacillus suebicus DSM 5007 = KCTC 3549 TaxID=1423807 RepID=A0A0R1W1W9_9LACO|nr:TetR/AcrR family transcriptional regulator [Paucilactobacillus suebicus]KRM11822.1 TetR family transcriptional regulator [Paucilactobacillus suebicus DSM 5007 = KCTC 3549]